SKTISRVMSWAIICLGTASPLCSSDQPEARRAAALLLSGLASDGVYMCPLCYQRGGSLLHCLSTLTRTESSKEAFCLLLSSPPGRFISVALALESPPPDVIRHPAL